jgi:hypothetical protein
MSDKKADSSSPWQERQAALSRWDNEGGTGSHGLRHRFDSGPPPAGTPRLKDAELVQLRIRVIALENLVIALLAQSHGRQRDLARELAAHISPRPGFTQHRHTVHAAAQMVHLVERADHFRDRRLP